MCKIVGHTIYLLHLEGIVSIKTSVFIPTRQTYNERIKKAYEGQGKLKFRESALINYFSSNTYRPPSD
jgi:hypothetical protein